MTYNTFKLTLKSIQLFKMNNIVFNIWTKCRYVYHNLHHGQSNMHNVQNMVKFSINVLLFLFDMEEFQREQHIGLTVGTNFKKRPTDWIRKVVCSSKIANTKISSAIYSRNINFCFLHQQKEIFRQSILRAFEMFTFLWSTTRNFRIKCLKGSWMFNTLISIYDFIISF